nr:MAG TPA: hypothetical protein [Caudoviricetes sp.]
MKFCPLINAFSAICYSVSDSRKKRNDKITIIWCANVVSSCFVRVKK